MASTTICKCKRVKPGINSALLFTKPQGMTIVKQLSEHNRLWQCQSRPKPEKRTKFAFERAKKRLIYFSSLLGSLGCHFIIVF